MYIFMLYAFVFSHFFFFFFAAELLGIGSGKSRLTNERLLELFHPSNAGLPYVYEDFTSWGNTDVNLL